MTGDVDTDDLFELEVPFQVGVDKRSDEATRGSINVDGAVNVLLNQQVVETFNVLVLSGICRSSGICQCLSQNSSALQRLQDANLFLKLSKCTFDATTIEYLGMIITHGSMVMDPVKIKGITDWPTPRNVKDVRAFLGFRHGSLQALCFQTTSPVAELPRPRAESLVSSALVQSGSDLHRACSGPSPLIPMIIDHSKADGSPASHRSMAGLRLRRGRLRASLLCVAIYSAAIAIIWPVVEVAIV